MKRFILLILFSLLIAAGAIPTKGFTYLNGHINSMITTGLWIFISIAFIILLIKNVVKKAAEKAKIVPFKDL